MEITVASDSDRKLWDDIVERSPNGFLYHTWDWLRLIEKYSHLNGVNDTGIRSVLLSAKPVKLYPLLITHEGDPVCIFPVFVQENPLFRSCTSPPLADLATTVYLGPLYPGLETMKNEKRQAFLVEIHKTIDPFIKNTLRPRFIQVNAPPGFTDCRCFKWSGYSVNPRFTYFLDLREGSEKIHTSLNKNLRYEMRKAQKDGITVGEGDKDDGLFIFDRLKERNRTNFSREYLKELLDTFYPGTMKIFITKAGDERLTGIITVMYKDKIAAWTGTPKCAHKATGINELTIWEFIRWATEHGYRTCELTNGDDFPLFPFKRKFNGELTPYYQIRWSSRMYAFFSSMTNVMKDTRGVL